MIPWCPFLKFTFSFIFTPPQWHRSQKVWKDEAKLQSLSQNTIIIHKRKKCPFSVGIKNNEQALNSQGQIPPEYSVSIKGNTTFA